MSDMRRIKVDEISDLQAGYCLAGFEDVCFWGDWIVSDDVIRYVFDPLGGHEELPIGWEHRECGEAERAVFVRPDR